jgi:hypothetical protein
MVDDDAERALTELRGLSRCRARRSDSAIGDPDAAVVVYAFEERYEIRKRLGEGGTGEVRLCRDRMIGREVAMKVVLPSTKGRGEIQARFVREARVQEQLEHPAIVAVHDFGVDSDGNAFFTMNACEVSRPRTSSIGCGAATRWADDGPRASRCRRSAFAARAEA